MNNATRVVVCGHSLYLEAMVELLRSQPNIEATYINWQRPDALARTRAFLPDVIIVEYGQKSDSRILDLLQQGYPLLGLNAKQKSITILSERHIPATGMADLSLLIEQVIH